MLYVRINNVSFTILQILNTKHGLIQATFLCAVRLNINVADSYRTCKDRQGVEQRMALCFTNRKKKTRERCMTGIY